MNPFNKSFVATVLCAVTGCAGGAQVEGESEAFVRVHPSARGDGRTDVATFVTQPGSVSGLIAACDEWISCDVAAQVSLLLNDETVSRLERDPTPLPTVRVTMIDDDGDECDPVVGYAVPSRISANGFADIQFPRPLDPEGPPRIDSVRCVFDRNAEVTIMIERIDDEQLGLGETKLIAGAFWF